MVSGARVVSRGEFLESRFGVGPVTPAACLCCGCCPRILLRGLLRTLRREAPTWSQTLPAIPRLVHRLLAEDRLGRLEAALEQLTEVGRRRNRLLAALVALGAALLGVLLLL